MTTNRQGPSSPGLYGLKITGLPDTGYALNPAPVDWPVLAVRIMPAACDAEPPPGTLELTAGGARAWLPDGVRLEMTRDPLGAVFSSPDPLGGDALLHPLLALPGFIANFWLGRQVLHGGAFAFQGRAWAILGDRGAGKSSTLAGLMSRGLPILSDDVLAIAGHELFGGPPSIDLREDAAAVLGGTSLGTLGSRPRWRLRPDVPPLSLPLGGFVSLEWGDEVSVSALGLTDRLSLLTTSSEIRLEAQSADSLLALLDLPAFRLRRPPDLAQLAPAIDQALLTISGA